MISRRAGLFALLLSCLPQLAVSADLQAAVSAAEESRTAPSGEQQDLVLTAEQWDRNRSGRSILQLPVLNRVMQQWLRDRSQMLEIQYPGGEEGEFWVQELSDWLVSLGLPSRQMVLSPGSGGGDLIRFRLLRGRG